MEIHLTPALVASTATVVLPVTALAVGYMRLAMSNAIRGLKLDLLRELNETYTRRGECQVVHSDLAQRLGRMDGELGKLERHLGSRLVSLEALARGARAATPHTETED